MDTGPDCLTGQVLWDEGNKKMVRMSVRDNLLGGSPDSMAFYPENEFYTYGQIAWLENILKAIEPEKDADSRRRRIFVCLHAPPVNVKKRPAITPGLWEVELKDPRVTIGKWRLKLLFWRPDIWYGTVNHYLSQFFHLCLGKKEGDAAYSGPVADIVFSGHGHKKIEFRIAYGQTGPIVFCGPYSDTLAPAGFDEHRPFIVQTAACGPISCGYSSPPYYRVIRVGAKGVILGFA
jgi:hypothetical protein